MSASPGAGESIHLQSETIKFVGALVERPWCWYVPAILEATTIAPPSLADLAAHLVEARRYTDQLLASVSDDDLVRQFSELQSPLVWDYAHIGHFEELWLLRKALGRRPSVARFDDIYDAFAHPRCERPTLDLLPPDEARAFVADVRDRVLEALPALVEQGDPRLVAGGFVVGLVVQHELQHAETMAQTLQAADDVRYATANAPTVRGELSRDEVFVPAGPWSIGTRDGLWTYDNERPPSDVDVRPFFIDASSVTNASWLAFIADGGYRDPRHWSEAGWAWRQRDGAQTPLYWRHAGAGYQWRRFGGWAPVDPSEPVQHVWWFEADAFARWAGRRLPTEAEWEKAATMARRDVDDANVGRRLFGPAPAGTSGGRLIPGSCAGMIGDVWEWTSPAFAPYPGFEPYPYPEYSAVFVDGYRVLRGGSWATHRLIARPTFRNWDLPERRQIFAGLRTARDG